MLVLWKATAAYAIGEVAAKIDGAIREFYRPGEFTPYAVEESDNPQYSQDGEPATYIIQESQA